MNVRKFFAPSSREALRLVREALGADAVVLSNRVVDGGVELVALTEATLTDWVDDRAPAPDAALPESGGFAAPVALMTASTAPTAPRAAIGPFASTRDRTQAAPGVLAARRVGDDGASALAYVHRATQASAPFEPISPARAAEADFQPALEADTADAADTYLDEDDRADVVWTPSSRVTAAAEPTLGSHAQTAESTAPLNAAMPPKAMSERPRSLFARVFSRSSFRDRAAADESSIPGLRRPEKQEEEASVLGLKRAERGERELSGTSGTSGSAALTPSQASARGLGAVSGPIVMRPAAMPETPMAQRAAPLPTMPEFALPSAPETALESALAPVPVPVTPMAIPMVLPRPTASHPTGFAPIMYATQTRVKAGPSVQTVVSGISFSAAATAQTVADRQVVENVAGNSGDASSVALSVQSIFPPTDGAPVFDFSDAAQASVMEQTNAPMSAPMSAEAPVHIAVQTAAEPLVRSTVIDSPRDVAGQVLSEMRHLCGTLGEQLEALGTQEKALRDPTRLAMTRMMLACGFSTQLVKLLLAKMPSVANADEGLSWVKATFERNLPVLDNEDALMEQGGVFALMGPTGVGKTTTTAKLAARAVMRHGADRVALLTTDSYRIGAHEQLRIYGRILGVAVHAVKDAADLGLVLSELRNKHMVLIDTIGMSQRDRAVSEQVQMLHGSHLPVKRLLLLNATSHGDTLNEVVKAYGAADASGTGAALSGCIITKVDESNGIGTALDTVMRHRLPVHYVSNGQKVPEDLRVARRSYLIDEAFSGAHRESAYLPDNDDLGMLFGTDGAATHHAYGMAANNANNASGEVYFG